MANNKLYNPTLVWPPYIASDDAFKNRKVYINVLQMNTYKQGVTEALDKAINYANSLKDTATRALAGDAKGMVEAAKRNGNKNNKELSTLMCIALPLPNTLTDNQGHKWSAETGIIGTIGGSAESFSILGVQVQQALGSLANQSGTRKPLFDPGYFQNYTGSEPRTFNMSWDLVPSSEKEAEDIIEIILKLKAYSAPATGINGVTIQAPNFFDISLENDYIDQMIHMKGVVLTNINVDYGADGFMQQTPDGMPKYIKLDLTFAERRMMTQNDYM